MTKVPLLILALLSLSITPGMSVSPKQTGCYHHQSVLICKAEVPYSEDLKNPQLQTLVLSFLPVGTQLFLDDTDYVDNGIQKVEIQKSSIDKVQPGYFAKVAGKNKVKRVTLRKVQGDVVVDKDMLQGLEKSLNYLTVTNGLAVNIADLAAMEYLTNLELLDTKVIGTPTDFENLLPQLRSLDIRKCNLTRLPWEALAKWVTGSDSRRLKINDNNWNCDCSMVQLKRLQPSVVASELQNLTCGGPPNLAGKTLSSLTDKDLCPADESDIHGVNPDGNPNSLSGSGGGSVGIGLGPSSGGSGAHVESGSSLEGQEVKTKASGVRPEIIIAASVVGVLVLAFVIFIIVYKSNVLSKNKGREERASKTHQNKRYVNVIEEPPLQQYGSNGRSKENGKYGEGAPV